MSAAYYATLYAARAALSEEDGYAKTHAGTWTLFRRVFVATGRFDSALTSEAQGAQALREGADYDAAPVTERQAEDVIAVAERFVAAVDNVLRD